TVKVAGAVGAKKLLPLLDDAAITTGKSTWDDKSITKLGRADKKAFQTHYDRVVAAVKSRTGYLGWLMAAVLPDGLDRVLDIARTAKSAPARVVAAGALAAS